jgi:hypothetical protein
LKIFDYDYLPLLMIRKFYHTRNKRARIKADTFAYFSAISPPPFPSTLIPN